MLKIYEGEVFIIELEEFKKNIKQTLDNITKNPDYSKMVFLLKKAGKIIAATNLKNFLENKIEIKTFLNRKGVFIEARDYCLENQVPYDTFFPVINEMGECLYLLYYEENKIYTQYRPGGHVFPPLEYNLKEEEKMDYSLVKCADVYIISQLEEYTYAIVLLLLKKYPEKTIIMLDKSVVYFPELIDCVMYIEPAKIDFKDMRRKFYSKHSMWIISEGVNYNDFPYGCFINIYNSINVLYSMVWCSKKESFGECNKDSVIYVADFCGERTGLMGYVRGIYEHYLIAKRHKWKFCVDLSNKPNQYLDSAHENMWDYFFEPLSDVSVEEAYKSFSVIRASHNNISMNDLLLPYIREESDKNANAMRNVKFNLNTRIRIQELMPEELKNNGNCVLGVVLRGTDYRDEANRKKGRGGVKVAGLQKMIAKCKFIIDLYGYQYIFLATEDLEYYKKMKEEFGNKCLSIDQKRVYYDYEGEYKSCAELLEIENGKEFGRRYLAILQALANCRALIANIDSGVAWGAKGLNGSKYEYYEIVSP